MDQILALGTFYRDTHTYAYTPSLSRSTYTRCINRRLTYLPPYHTHTGISPTTLTRLYLALLLEKKVAIVTVCMQ